MHSARSRWSDRDPPRPKMAIQGSRVEQATCLVHDSAQTSAIASASLFSLPAFSHVRILFWTIFIDWQHDAGISQVHAGRDRHAGHADKVREAIRGIYRFKCFIHRFHRERSAILDLHHPGTLSRRRNCFRIMCDSSSMYDQVLR